VATFPLIGPAGETTAGERMVAADIARGCLRLLAGHGYYGMREVTLGNQRRADVVAIGMKGDIWLIEIKSGVADFRADSKWREYMPYCDRFWFAVNADFPQALIPDEAGLIIADRFDGAIVRDAPVAPLPAARRKAMTLRFARLAALRLQAETILST
jgi:hypothetical protein